MTKKQIYLKAAKRIAEGLDEFSCNAVLIAGDDVAVALYTASMSPQPRSLIIMDIEEAVNSYSNSGAAREFRILLLCMMAAACDDLL